MPQAASPAGALVGVGVVVGVETVRAERDAEGAEVGVGVDDAVGGGAVFTRLVGRDGVEFIFGVHVYYYTNFSFTEPTPATRSTRLLLSRQASLLA